MRRQTMTTRTFAVAGLAGALAAMFLGGGLAHAQDVALPEPISAANKGGEGEAEIALDVDREIDLANVVTSAAKGVTTIQEAPAIISIITSEEIKARGFRWLEDAIATVPGWETSTALGQQVFVPQVRGVQQAMLLLRDGITMFDAYGNVTPARIPLENVKRIEIVTGPGGVLWGANSFLGIVNIISKDADDVNGLELSAGYGDGPGNKQNFKAYAMFGRSFWKGKLKLMQHVSYENYIGPVYNMAQKLAYSPSPQPVGPDFYGALTSTDPSRSWLVTVDGKYSLGPVTLSYNVPVGDLHPQITFANNPNNTGLWNRYDRWAILEYKDRFWKDRLGLSVKGYYSQLVTDFQVQLLPASSLFPPFTEPGGTINPGGLRIHVAPRTQRTGGTVDVDMNLKYGIRILFGGEFFWEQSTGGVSFPSPSSPNLTPIVCPQTQQADGSFTPVLKCPRSFIDGSRYVGALYVNAQYKPVQKLTFDGGVRLQKGFGELPYDFTPLYSGAIVYNFLPDYHLKATYATGFRPPVVNAVASAPGGIDYGSDPKLKNETSQSFQAEVNARLLRNVRKVRELELRVDYAYTFLDQIIQISAGRYGNTGKRAIHSVEAFARIYLQGDHFLQAAYTFLHATTSDVGIVRANPNHVISLGASFNLVKNVFDLNANLLVTSAYEDLNRYPTSQSPVAACPAGVTGCATPTTQARSSDQAWDRLTPVALLQLGFRLRFFKEKLGISGQFYNVLNQRYYNVDGFYDLTPSTETTPIPAAGFNFFAAVTYRP